MDNTEREKINILTLYDITVSDKGGQSYEVIYKDDKVYYNKVNFKNINTYDVIICILRVFNLNKDILLKEKYLIDNKFNKYWVNSKFCFVKNNIKIPYSYGLYKENSYEEFVKNIGDKYLKQIKETPYGNYSEIENHMELLYKNNKKNNDYNVSDLKIKKENIKRILFENKMMV